MAYTSPWERLSEALTRVMKASGLTQREAQTDICRAIADRAVRVQGKLGRHASRGITSSDTVLQGRDLLVPTNLNPEDFDWQESRPIKTWTVPHGTPVLHGAWKLEWIRLFTSDVINALCGGTAGGKPAVQNVPGKVATRRKSRPAFERAQHAIKAVYPNGVPRQSIEPNSNLCRRIGEWLKNNGLPNVSDDTILRAGNRRK